MVAAVRGLAESRVPVCRLDVPMKDHYDEASNDDRGRHLNLELSLATSHLFEVRRVAGCQHHACSCDGTATQVWQHCICPACCLCALMTPLSLGHTPQSAAPSDATPAVLQTVCHKQLPRMPCMRVWFSAPPRISASWVEVAGWLNCCYVPLVQSTEFQAVSGPHLAAVMYFPAFDFSAPSGAFPQLQHLAYVHTRLVHGLPPSLQWLGLRVRCLKVEAVCCCQAAAKSSACQVVHACC